MTAVRVRTRRGFKVLAVATAVLVATALGESALWVAGFSHPSFFETDPVAGMRHIPGARGRFNLEGDGYVEINRKGWRDQERAFAKPGSVTRIAVLGDSYTEAMHVDREETFVFRLERELKELRSQVLNFGVSGYGTGQELLILREHVLAYAPDLVLLAFLTGNDVSDNHRALKGTGYVPYFELVEGQLQLDDSFLESAAYLARRGAAARLVTGLTRYSRLAQLASRARMAKLHSRRRAQRGRRGRGRELGLSDAIYSPPASQEWREAWAVTEALLTQMHRELAEQGVAFGVVVLSNGIQVHPDSQLKADWMERLGVPDLFYPDRRIEALAARVGFPVLTLAPVFAEEAARDNIYFHGFGVEKGRGHWNEAGHRRAAELIAAWLFEVELLGRAPQRD